MVKDIDGGVTGPTGFRSGTAECGVKTAGRPDLAVIVSDVPASCAGLFTTNRIKGAPVLVSRENVKRGTARAIITSTAGGCPEVVGKAGLLVEPKDISAIRETLMKLIDSEEQRQNLGRSALERVKEFSWDRIAAAYVDCYRKLAQKN